MKRAMLLLLAVVCVDAQQVVSFISWMVTFGCLENGRPGSARVWPLPRTCTLE